MIDTLGLSDFIGVISFSTDANILAYTELKRATVEVRLTLTTKIKELKTEGKTNYELAFSKVYEILDNTYSNELGSSCPNA